MKKLYTVRFDRDADSGWWVVTVPEIPGCLTQGRSLAEGRRRIREALALFIDEKLAATVDLVDDVRLPRSTGAVVKQANLGNFTPLTTGDLYLGLRPVGGAAGTRFVGQMDEISLYNRALSAAEIQAIYGAGSAGKCASGEAPVITIQPASQAVPAGG